MPRLLPGALVLALAAIAAPPALAQQAQLREYVAPEGCPSRQSAQGAFADASFSGVPISITLREWDGAFSGHLRQDAPFTRGPGTVAPTWSRTLSGLRCDEVLSALALSLAVHLDEQRGPADELPRATPLDAPRPIPWSLGGVTTASARSGLGPQIDLSLALGLSLRAPGAALGLSLELAAESTATSNDVRWSHDWWSASASGCPWAHALSTWLRLEPCAALHVGRYTARIVEAASSSDWLVFAELQGALGAQLGPWLARLSAGGLLPLDPLRASRQGDVFFRQQPGWVVGLSLGADALAL